MASGTQLPVIDGFCALANAFGGSKGDPDGTLPSIGGPPSGVTYLYCVFPNIAGMVGAAGPGAGNGLGKGNILRTIIRKIPLSTTASIGLLEAGDKTWALSLERPATVTFIHLANITWLA